MYFVTCTSVAIATFMNQLFIAAKMFSILSSLKNQKNVNIEGEMIRPPVGEGFRAWGHLCFQRLCEVVWYQSKDVESIYEI